MAAAAATGAPVAATAAAVPATPATAKLIKVKFTNVSNGATFKLAKQFYATVIVNQEQAALPDHIKDSFRKILTLHHSFEAPLRFANKHLELEYHDDDGDEISVSTQEDMDLAIAVGIKVFKLTLMVRSRGWGRPCQ